MTEHDDREAESEPQMERSGVLKAAPERAQVEVSEVWEVFARGRDDRGE